MGRPPLTRTLDVCLNGRLVGHYRSGPSGGISFSYARPWLDWDRAFAISRQLPLMDGTQSGTSVSAVFENLLPDNDVIRRRIAERTDARSDRPHDLLAAIGRDCVGALQFLPHGEQPGDPFRIEGEVQSEAEIAETLRNLSMAPLGIAPGRPFRISLAGAQEKTAYLRQNGQWLQPVGMTPTTHIFKRPLGLINDHLDLTDSVENEWLCLALARAIGLPTAEAEIARFEDEIALVVTRFDRRPRSRGGLLRLPQEDFLQAMGLPSGQKYQQYGGPSMVACLDLLAGSRDRFLDQKTFLKAQIFFWMIAAIDGHAKNYSIFIEPDGYRMTPLYDILSVAPAPLRNQFRNREIQLAMSVGRRNHYRLDQIVPRHFEQTATLARLPVPVRKAAFEELAREGAAAFDRVEANLPSGFPSRIAEPILDYGRDRLRLVEAFAATLQ